MNSNVIVRCKLYIGYTSRHLHQRVEKRHKHSVIGKHFSEKHNLKRLNLNDWGRPQRRRARRNGCFRRLIYHQLNANFLGI